MEPLFLSSKIINLILMITSSVYYSTFTTTLAPTTFLSTTKLLTFNSPVYYKMYICDWCRHSSP